MTSSYILRQIVEDASLFYSFDWSHDGSKIVALHGTPVDGKQKLSVAVKRPGFLETVQETRLVSLNALIDY